MATVDPLVLLVQAEAQVLVGAQERGWLEVPLRVKAAYRLAAGPEGRLQAAYPQGEALVGPELAWWANPWTA